MLRTLTLESDKEGNRRRIVVFPAKAGIQVHHSGFRLSPERRGRTSFVRRSKLPQSVPVQA